MALAAQLEAMKTEVEGMKAHGGYSEESFFEISRRMEDLSEELKAL
jgi:hypothetical protein